MKCSKRKKKKDACLLLVLAPRFESSAKGNWLEWGAAWLLYGLMHEADEADCAHASI